MSHPSCRFAFRRRFLLAGMLSGCLIVLGDGLSATETPSRERRIDAHLAVGEFAPALTLAQAVSNERRRDAHLARIAVAQSRAGLRSAAAMVAGGIRDQSLRANTLAGISREPIKVAGAAGGASLADFDSLIDLITSTIAPTSWDDVGGPGSIDAFPGGVYVDAQGALRSALKGDATGRLTKFRRAAATPADNAAVRNASPMRKVSLPRLEHAVQLRLATGKPLDEEMLLLAGLQRIEYVLVYPDSGDLVLAGPAGDWRTSPEGRIVAVDHGRPVVRLDDLVVLLRHMLDNADARFGCAITPRSEALAKAQQYLNATSGRSIPSNRRDAWLEDLRRQVGSQKIEISGIDPRTRVAQVLVEADYRMKLVGLGLEEGTVDVPSYLDLIEVAKGQSAPPMDVLRWWFVMDYDAVLADADRGVFELRGEGVRVLSENELLTAKGERIHTGKSDVLNQEFTGNFTQHFDQLAAKYPIYAELRNIFDLALVGALCRAEDLPAKVGWRASCFRDPEQYLVELGSAPTSVETVANHRVINKVHILAAVSGGVDANPVPLVTGDAIHTDRTGKLDSHWHRSEPPEMATGGWWWD